MALVGVFEQLLDEFGRIVIPKDLRRELGDETKTLMAVALEEEECVRLYPPRGETIIMERLGAKLEFSTEESARVRMFSSNARNLTRDAHWRVRIPEEFRARAKLKREVVVVGAGLRIEVWDKERWMSYKAKTEPKIRIDELGV